jgi:hypothetical protein
MGQKFSLRLFTTYFFPEFTKQMLVNMNSIATTYASARRKILLPEKETS